MNPNTSGSHENADADPRSEGSSEDGRDAEAARDNSRGPASEKDVSGTADDASGDHAASDAPSTAAPEGTRTELEREIVRLNDRHLRLAAEFENYRKRVRGEQRETWARAQADLVGRLVDSVDDLQRVALLDPATATVQDIVRGVDMVERKMLRALEDAGLEVLDPTGQDFDPRVMEAVMRAPAASEEEDDTVDMVLQRGYLLQGHLVRPARVSVRKHG